MPTINDLVTDLASIVTSSRAGELMTLKKIEDNYRFIYGRNIPCFEFGYSSLEKLLECFPTYFNFSIADGVLIIRTNVKSNITELIAKEKTPKKVSYANLSNSLFKKHRRKDMQIEPQLPVLTIKNLEHMLETCDKSSLHKDEFLKIFESQFGYELKFLDYGYRDFEHLLGNLDGKVLCYYKNNIYPMRKSDNNMSIYDYIKKILSHETGFTISTLQEYISSYDNKQIRIHDLMKTEGFVNFIDVIYDAESKKFLSYDFDLIYPYTDRVALKTGLYPIGGVNEISFLHVTTPYDFYFSITASPLQPSIDYIDERMQELASQMKLLSLFKQHKICAVEYDSRWYRAQIVSLCCQKNYESVKLQFIDHCIEIETGIQIGLPTDRLRFLPDELERIPAYIHKGSLAYVKPFGGGFAWRKDACEVFSRVVKDDCRLFQAFVVQHELDGRVCIDVVAWNPQGDKMSIFHELLMANVADIDLG